MANKTQCFKEINDSVDKSEETAKLHEIYFESKSFDLEINTSKSFYTHVKLHVLDWHVDLLLKSSL